MAGSVQLGIVLMIVLFVRALEPSAASHCSVSNVLSRCEVRIYLKYILHIYFPNIHTHGHTYTPSVYLWGQFREPFLPSTSQLKFVPFTDLEPTFNYLNPWPGRNHFPVGRACHVFGGLAAIFGVRRATGDVNG